MTVTERLDIAVLNAGITLAPARIADSTDADWETTFAVNLFVVVRTARASVPLLKVAGGKIIVIGSGTGHQPIPWIGAYGASKAAVASVVGTLAVELRREEIAVNELIPGPVITDLNPSSDSGGTNWKPTGEWIKQPEDVNDLALFLARAPNNGPTGQRFSLMGRPL